MARSYQRRSGCSDTRTERDESRGRRLGTRMRMRAASGRRRLSNLVTGTEFGWQVLVRRQAIGCQLVSEKERDSHEKALT